MKPNKERIAEWVKDLRSGKFKQGERYLRQDDKFCCLGVGCETYTRLTGEGNWSDKWFHPTKEESSGAYLPNSVREFFGLGEANPIIIGDIMATHANDTLKWTFAQIADALEKTYLSDETEAPGETSN